MERELLFGIDAGVLEGTLRVPDRARGLVLLPDLHEGSGAIARALGAAGLATVRVELLTAEERQLDELTRVLHGDVAMLATRLLMWLDHATRDPQLHALPAGCLATGAAAAAALVAATRRPDRVVSIVACGGRPDLANAVLDDVVAPTLLIVGGADLETLALNRTALHRIAAAERALEVVPGAGRLLEERDALEQVARLATHWFIDTLETRDAVEFAPPPPPA